MWSLGCIRKYGRDLPVSFWIQTRRMLDIPRQLTLQELQSLERLLIHRCKRKQRPIRRPYTSRHSSHRGQKNQVSTSDCQLVLDNEPESTYHISIWIVESEDLLLFFGRSRRTRGTHTDGETRSGGVDVVHHAIPDLRDTNKK